MLICSITLFELICMHVENVFFKHKGLFHRHEPEKKLAYLCVKITWIIFSRIISLNMDFYIVQMQSWQVTRKIVACTLCLMEKFQHFSLCSDLKGKRFACCWIVVILLIILTFFSDFMLQMLQFTLQNYTVNELWSKCLRPFHLNVLNMSVTLNK